MNTRPGCLARVATSSNSVGVSATSRSPTDTRIRGTSSVTSATRITSAPPAAAWSVRRSTARTRATSSFGLNGLTM